MKNLLYTLIKKASSLSGIGIVADTNADDKLPFKEIYNIDVTTNKNEKITLNKYKGKSLLIVNTASQCGFTPQLAELENLHQQFKNLEILAFPSNDFGNQEPGSNTTIEQFCQINYGSTFPIFIKDKVSGEHKQPLYSWLSDPLQNGWNVKEPKWNFYKYLIGESGILIGVFSSAISPLDKKITGLLK